jgi:hypothetical protein
VNKYGNEAIEICQHLKWKWLIEIPPDLDQELNYHFRFIVIDCTKIFHFCLIWFHCKVGLTVPNVNWPLLYIDVPYISYLYYEQSVHICNICQWQHILTRNAG